MKTFKLSIIAFAALVIFAGCSKPENQARKPSKNIDSSTWIENLIDGKAAAEKENKKILIFFSSDDQDAMSLSFKENCFNKPEFIEKATKDFVLVNLDFSISKFEEATADPLASEEEKELAGQRMAILEENTRDATLYDIQGTPCFYVLTKEGYVITELIFENENISVSDFDKVIEENSEKIAVYENILASTKTGKTEDRLNAINRLFEITDPQQRYLLADKAEEYIKLDKKNTTGANGAYVVAIANAKAIQAYLDQDVLKGSQAFANAAESKYLSASEKQQCYYTAGYLLASSGSTDNNLINEYLTKAYDADPENPDAESIKTMIRMMDEDYQKSILMGVDPTENK